MSVFTSHARHGHSAMAWFVSKNVRRFSFVREREAKFFAVDAGEMGSDLNRAQPASKVIKRMSGQCLMRRNMLRLSEP